MKRTGLAGYSIWYGMPWKKNVRTRTLKKLKVRHPRSIRHAPPALWASGYAFTPKKGKMPLATRKFVAASWPSLIPFLYVGPLRQWKSRPFVLLRHCYCDSVGLDAILFSVVAQELPHRPLASRHSDRVFTGLCDFVEFRNDQVGVERFTGL